MIDGVGGVRKGGPPPAGGGDGPSDPDRSAVLSGLVDADGLGTLRLATAPAGAQTHSVDRLQDTSQVIADFGPTSLATGLCTNVEAVLSANAATFKDAITERVGALNLPDAFELAVSVGNGAERLLSLSTTQAELSLRGDAAGAQRMQKDPSVGLESQARELVSGFLRAEGVDLPQSARVTLEGEGTSELTISVSSQTLGPLTSARDTDLRQTFSVSMSNDGYSVLMERVTVSGSVDLTRMLT